MMDKRPILDVVFVILDLQAMLENSAVLQSQVGDQLIALQAAGVKTGLLAVSRDPVVFESVIGRRLRGAGVYIALIQAGGLVRNVLRMARKLRRERRLVPIRFAYARGIWGVVVLALANPIRRIPYTYDVRGALTDETLASGALRLKCFLYSALEAWSIRCARQVSAVSRPLADAVSRSYGLVAVNTIPSCVHVDDIALSPEEIANKRAALGFRKSDIVLTYSGGLSFYQEVPAMLALWRQVRCDPDVRFLILTNDDPRSLPADIGDLTDFQSNLRHLSLSRSEALRMLAACDVGFMLRNPRDLNKVASPVKFAEYLAAGLAVVGSPGTGDASRLIDEHGIGVLVDPGNLDEAEQRLRSLLQRLRTDRLALRERALALARSQYDWTAYDELFRRFYCVAPTS